MATILDRFEKERQAHDKPVKMTIESKVPSKWRFVDLETGDVWRWDRKDRGLAQKGNFRRAGSIREMYSAYQDMLDEIAKDNPWSDETILTVRETKDNYEIQSDEDPKAKSGMWFGLAKDRAGKLVPKKGDTIAFYGRGSGYQILGIAINGKRLY